MCTVTGKVLDKNDLPIPGARVWPSKFLQQRSRRFSARVFGLNMGMLRGTCDKTGSFELHFIPFQGLSYSLRAFTTLGGRSVSGQGQFKIGLESIKDAKINLQVDVRKQGAKTKGS